MTATEIAEPYRFMDLKAAVQTSGLGYSTLRKRIKARELPAFHAGTGRKLYVRAIDLRNLMVSVALPSEKD